MSLSSSRPASAKVDNKDQQSDISPRKLRLLEQIRCATAENTSLSATCPTLSDVLSRLPENFPRPAELDIRLFHLAVRGNSRRLVDKLMREFPTIVLHKHFDETPLIAAIRCGHEELAVHLVEHGASVLCSKMLFDSANAGLSYDWYEVSAREMAYERRMLRLLEIVDYLTGNYFAYLAPPGIAIRMLRPVKPTEFLDMVEIPEDFFTNDYVKPGDKKNKKLVVKRSSPRKNRQSPKEQLPQLTHEDKPITQLKPRDSSSKRVRIKATE